MLKNGSQYWFRCLASLRSDPITLTMPSLILSATLYFVFFQNRAFWNVLWQATSHLDWMRYTMVVSVFAFLMAFIGMVLTIILWRPWAKIMLAALLIMGAASDYFALRYQIYTDKIMVANLFETHWAEAKSLFNLPFALHLLLYALLPIFVIWRIRIQPHSNIKNMLKQRCILSVAWVFLFLAAVFPLYKHYAAISRNQTGMGKLIVPSNIINGLSGYIQLKTATIKPLQKIGEDAIILPQPKPKLIIMVLGETSRAQNFALNGYPRPTNPQLLQYPDLLNFPDVHSCGTSTTVSVPCLFSNMTREDYSLERAVYQENLLDIAKRSGYQVLWRENDGGCKGVCARIHTENVSDYIDEKNDNNEGLYYDDMLLQGLEKHIGDSNTLIVLHTNGSHGPEYYKRYRPTLSGLFLPSCQNKAIETCSQESLVNTYDNTIVHVDDMLHKTILSLQKYQQSHDVAMFYVSDHGESLGEKGFYLHSAPYRIAPKEQTQVPMMMWASADYWQNQHLNLSCLQHAAKTADLSHDYVFHSLLRALNIQTKEYTKQLDMFNICPNAAQNKY